MNKLQISFKIKTILARLDYVKLPIGTQEELLKAKCDLEELYKKLKKEHLEETK